ncbi:MAG TPA: DUF488 domain-containing protein [Pyrinomonadaceae bacterium]|nr:DUF488 domain-containing protein [Pyrinomonadaceae bacterium]
MTDANAPTIYTIGHGRHAWADFLALLKEHEIALVCDVRSAARSRWPQFNGRVLEASLREARIGYEWLPECGGKVVAPPPELARGLDRIMELAAEMRVALMCSESQPLTRHTTPRANCHRVGLLSTPLRARGARIIHILPGGQTLETDESLLPSIWTEDNLANGER